LQEKNISEALSNINTFFMNIPEGAHFDQIHTSANFGANSNKKNCT
jgi:hypothetical protein